MNKKTIFVLILCLVVCIIPTFSSASTKTQIVLKGVDRAPRIQCDRSNEKNFIIKLVENGSISSVKLEKIENGKATVLVNKNSKTNKVAKGITISKDMKEIKLTTKTYLNTKNYTTFRITAYDNNSIDKNRLVAYFNVKKYKAKDPEKGWYGVNDSPRLSYSDGFTIKVKDYSEVQSLTVKDRNNKNAVVSIGNPLSGSTEIEKSYKINLAKLVAKNDMYFLELTVVDKTGTKRVEEIIVKTEKINTQKTPTTTPTKNNNQNQNKVQATGVTLDRTILMLDTDHYNVATLKATIAPSNATDKTISWISSNTNIATVDANGNIKAKKAGTVTITAKTANGKTAKCSLKVITHMTKVSKDTPGAVKGKRNAPGYWMVKKEKFTAEQVESYVNNAEMLCKTGDYEKYPESKAITLPIYDGIYNKKTIKKAQGLSATNYLVLVTSTNQKLYIMQKQNGVWKKIKEYNTSTGRYSGGKHNRFDFYIGAAYINPTNGIKQLNEFWQFTGTHQHKLDGTNISEQRSSGRTFHPGPVYKNGTPSSAGCNHLTNAALKYMWNNRTKLLGARAIVY